MFPPLRDQRQDSPGLIEAYQFVERCRVSLSHVILHGGLGAVLQTITENQFHRLQSMVVRTQDIGRRCDVGDAPHSLEAGRQLVEVARTVDPAYLRNGRLPANSSFIKPRSARPPNNESCCRWFRDSSNRSEA